MRFTGQVKIPDLDYPGVPAAVLVEGKQVELFVEGESLGRWSLVDVRAERLISSAFSLKLAGEEVTFIADQPTEFAYGGVEEMANVWAKHRTMRFPRRLMANSRSRKGTKPSRIRDLRVAIEESLTGAPTALVYRREPVKKGAAGIESLRKSRQDLPVEDQANVDDEPAVAPPNRQPVAGSNPEHDRARAAGSTPAQEGGTPDALVASDPVPDAPDTPDVVLAEPDPEPTRTPPVTDSVFKESVPWAKREEAEVDVDHDRAPAIESSATAEPTVEKGSPDTPTGERPGVDEPSAGQAPQSPAASVPWIDPTALEPAEAQTEPGTGDPQPSRPDKDTGETVERTPFVVDLGAFEDTGDKEPVHSAPPPDRGEPVGAHEELQPELAAASARGGIMGAVRSAFVRNRVEHTHEYVEAPGGLGIKRQICTECGHISIGISH